jgi:hypothetical protein
VPEYVRAAVDSAYRRQYITGRPSKKTQVPGDGKKTRATADICRRAYERRSVLAGMARLSQALDSGRVEDLQTMVRLLLVPQRVDRVETGGAGGGVDAEEQADGRGRAGGKGDGLDGDYGVEALRQTGQTQGA